MYFYENVRANDTAVECKDIEWRERMERIKGKNDQKRRGDTCVATVFPLGITNPSIAFSLSLSLSLSRSDDSRFRPRFLYRKGSHPRRENLSSKLLYTVPLLLGFSATSLLLSHGRERRQRWNLNNTLFHDFTSLWAYPLGLLGCGIPRGWWIGSWQQQGTKG